MKVGLRLIVLTVLALITQASAQQGSVHYTGRGTPVYTGRSTPYTGQLTPAYTGRSTPYTGRPVSGSPSGGPYPVTTVPRRASKSRASIRRSGNRGRYRPPVRVQPTVIPAPVLGSQVDTLPVRYRTAYYQGYYYYYGNGYYYRGSDAPIAAYSSNFGVPRRKKPKKKKVDTSKKFPVKKQEKFKVVAPPVGLVVDELPTGSRQVKKGLYIYHDVRYRPIYSDGKVKYIVSQG